MKQGLTNCLVKTQHSFRYRAGGKWTCCTDLKRGAFRNRDPGVPPWFVCFGNRFLPGAPRRFPTSLRVLIPSTLGVNFLARYPGTRIYMSIANVVRRWKRIVYGIGQWTDKVARKLFGCGGKGYCWEVLRVVLVAVNIACFENGNIKDTFFNPIARHWPWQRRGDRRICCHLWQSTQWAVIITPNIDKQYDLG